MVRESRSIGSWLYPYWGHIDTEVVHFDTEVVRFDPDFGVTLTPMLRCSDLISSTYELAQLLQLGFLSAALGS